MGSIRIDSRFSIRFLSLPVFQNPRTIVFVHFKMPFESSNLPWAGPTFPDWAFENWPCHGHNLIQGSQLSREDRVEQAVLVTLRMLPTPSTEVEQAPSFAWQLPDGVRTNWVVAEVPQFRIINIQGKMWTKCSNTLQNVMLKIWFLFVAFCCFVVVVLCVYSINNVQ